MANEQQSAVDALKGSVGQVLRSLDALDDAVDIAQLLADIDGCGHDPITPAMRVVRHLSAQASRDMGKKPSVKKHGRSSGR